MRDEELDRMIRVLTVIDSVLRWLLIAVLWAALAFGVWAMACGRCESAPVPFPKATISAEAWLTGTVDAMDWGGTSYGVRFDPPDADGRRPYHCYAGDLWPRWSGRWSVSGRALRVIEWPAGRPGDAVEFSIDLDTMAVSGGYGSGFTAGLRPSRPGRR